MKLARDGHTDAEVIAALHAPKRTIRFRYELLDRNLKYKRDIKTISEGSIAFNSASSIMRTAVFVMRDDPIDYLSARIRPVFGLLMPTGWIEWPLGVFVLSSPQRTDVGSAIERRVEAYDLNQLLKADRISEALYFPAGTRYVDAVLSVLAGAGQYRAAITQSEKVLRADAEYQVGKTRLEIINGLLEAINYTPIHPDETGIFSAVPIRDPEISDIEYLYTTEEYSVIRSGTVEENDYFETPNVFIGFVSNPDYLAMVSVWENDDPTSPLSTVNRNRVAVEQQLNDIADQAELDAYVRRWAESASIAPHDIVLPTALMPMHGYKNIYQVTHERLGINEIYRETEWHMNLAVGGLMEHTARRL